MDIGIGLPNAVPGTSGQDLLNWARAAEEAGFSIARDDRSDRLSQLRAADRAERRGGGDRPDPARHDGAARPAPQNAAVVAKQALSLDALAGGGRVVLGIGLGGREDDYAVSGVSLAGRGAWQDRALDRSAGSGTATVRPRRRSARGHRARARA